MASQMADAAQISPRLPKKTPQPPPISGIACRVTLSTGEIMQAFNKYGWHAAIRLPRHPPPYYFGSGSSHGHGDENLDAVPHSAHREHLPRSQCGYTAPRARCGVAAAQSLIDHNAQGKGITTITDMILFIQV